MRPRRRTGEPRLSAAALSPALCPLGPTCRRQFPSLARSPSLSVSWARAASRRAITLVHPFLSLSASWASPVSSSPSVLAVDQRVRPRARRRVSRPRRHPCTSAPFLEPRQCPALAPHLISRSFALSRARPTPLVVAGDPRPRFRPSSSPETSPSLPELRPEVRHPSPCLIPLLRPMFGQFHLRRCSTVAVRRAHAVAGQFSPV